MKMEYLRYKQTPMSNNFKMSITDAVFANKKNDTPNAISSGFNTVDMFSMYDMSIMLKLCLDIWRRQLWMFFEIIAPPPIIPLCLVESCAILFKAHKIPGNVLLKLLCSPQGNLEI